MPEQKKVALTIAGTPIPSFVQLMLKQSINTHHYFEITLDIQAVERYAAGVPQESKAWIGQKVEIDLGGTPFTGIVTLVGLHRSGGTHGHLKVSGYSSTFLLESDPACASWCNKSLGAIVKELADKAGVNALVNPETQGTLEYECQYQETNFGFIQRLARQHREWLYYDGRNLVFGKPETGSAIPLIYGEELSELDVCSQALARAAQGSAYLALDNKTLSGRTPNAAAGQNELGQSAFDASLALFATPAVQLPEPCVANQSELTAYFQRKQQSDTAASCFITGATDTLSLTVGTPVDVYAAAHTDVACFQKEHIGTYLITEITHLAGMGDSYRNYFTALPATVPSLPCPEVPLPVAQPQLATVVSNEDPKGKGRVQVKMHWQGDGMQTAWIRVLAPDAGTSEAVAANRGFVFIPEKGDQVMIAFRHNDPNQPFVLGSMFHGESGAGGGASNKTKSLTTRSGCTVSFDDEQGSVTVRDKAGNSYTADGAGNITLSASKSITLCVGDNSLKIDSDGNITATAQNDITESAGQNLSQSARNITGSAQSRYDLSGTDFSASGSSSATLCGTSRATVDSSGTTAISGTIVKLN